jgi:hypothetical protein
MTFSNFKNTFFKLLMETNLKGKIYGRITVSEVEELAYIAWMAFGRVLKKYKLKLKKEK